MPSSKARDAHSRTVRGKSSNRLHAHAPKYHFLILLLSGALVLLALSFTVAQTIFAGSGSFASKVSRRNLLSRPAPKAATTSKLSLVSSVPETATLPIVFEENRGHFPEAVRFSARKGDVRFYFSPASLSIVFPKLKPRSIEMASAAKGNDAAVTVTQQLVRANQASVLHGVEKSGSVSNYFVGGNPQAWQTHVPNWKRIQYDDIYPGISLSYGSSAGKLSYEFVVAPKADPKQIAFRMEGVKKLSMLKHGNLEALTSDGSRITWDAPRAYQKRGDAEIPVAVSFALLGKNQYTFSLGAYDATLPLVIDPTLNMRYGTYVGGPNYELSSYVALDSAKNIYVAGETYGSMLSSPMTPFQGGLSDVYLMKFDPSGQTLLWSTYIGGSARDGLYSLALDASGNFYLGGFTASTDYPLKDAFDSTIGGQEGFYTKINAAGDSILYSTFLGGSNVEYTRNVIPDLDGNVYVLGFTSSGNFPTVHPYQAVHGGGYDFFLMKFDTDNTVLFSTYFGGSGSDQLPRMVLDATGAYIFGSTTSADFPVLNPYQATWSGGQDYTVTKFALDGSGPLFSTYLGGTGTDTASGIAVDSVGNIYISGQTKSTDFPTVRAIQPVFGGDKDGTVTKLGADGQSLIYSTYFGGSGSDLFGSLALDASRRLYVTGIVGSSDMPMQNAFQSSYNGGDNDIYFAQLSADGSALEFGTYLGGNGDDRALWMVADGSKVYLTGRTASTNFPTREPYQATYSGGDGDSFISIFDVLRIEPGKRTLTSVVSPAAFQEFTSGETISVAWQGQFVEQGGVKTASLFYNSNPADPWTLIAKDLPVSGPYAWTAPEVSERTPFRFRLELLDGTGEMVASNESEFFFYVMPKE